MAILAEADRLQSLADLIGASALPDHERVVLLAAQLLRDAVLKQSALSPKDAHCAPAKQAALLDLVLDIHDRCQELVGHGVPAAVLEEADLSDVARARDEFEPDDAASVNALRSDRLRALEEQVR
jgi:V/A-type H+-transporting ATPase subunit A